MKFPTRTVWILIVLAQAGCINSYHPRTNPSMDAMKTDAKKEELVFIWRSANSTARERVDALNKLLPHETSIDSARALLGDSGVLSRDYGPSLTFDPRQKPVVAYHGSYYEKLWLTYNMPGGLVGLAFSNNESLGSNWQFEHAYVLEQ